MPIDLRRLRYVAPVILVAALSVAVSGRSTADEWRYYGGDAAGTKYVPLEQINKTNVKDLQIAWRWKAENFGPRPDYNWQVTPLMVGGRLYFTAGTRRAVVSIDAATGETLWVHRFEEGRRGQLGPRTQNRGVAYWSDGKSERILYITQGYQLIALDAKTGVQVPSFGNNGVVDLYADFDQPTPKDGLIGSSSPPMIVGDIAVVGGALQAGGAPPAKENVAAHIRGYDVRTGKRAWIFHTIPRPGQFGHDTWQQNSWEYTGNTGAWAPMSADLELGYVYVPLETPTGDYYGGHRAGNNLFAESLVCLDAKTGERVWHYQLIHHGVWDWDLPTAPMLVDITVGGKPIKAVVQVTKQAWAYVFDRVTGKPVWPIEERPVPASSVPGENLAATQPFPTRPAPFDRQGISDDDLIDFTAELKAEARKIASEYKMGPIFTPPIAAGADGKKALLMVPAATGGANWQGGAVDAETGVLYVASVSSVTALGLVNDPKRSTMNYIQGPTRVDGPSGLPLVKPPWGRITAIDLNTGDHLWMVPNADTPDDVKNHPALKGVTLPRTGRQERSGILVTKSLMFAGEGSGLFAVPTNSGGPMFRAYDKRTGEIISEFKLPGNQTGIPMSYQIDGRQYIVVAVGARNSPAELVALVVP